MLANRGQLKCFFFSQTQQWWEQGGGEEVLYYKPGIEAAVCVFVFPQPAITTNTPATMGSVWAVHPTVMIGWIVTMGAMKLGVDLVAHSSSAVVVAIV